MADTSLIFNIVAKDKATGTMDKLRGRMKLVGVAAGVLALKFGKDSVQAYTEAQAAQNKLQDAFKRFPGLAGTNIETLRNLNTEWAKKTRFDDDAIASGQAVLAQFKLTGAQLQNTTPLLLDFAAKTGRDLPTAAGLMGKAFLGNTRALKDLGINYKSTGNQTQDMANITALMREKVGGFAEKEGKTAAGQAAILSNQFGEVQESVGSKLVPVLTTLAGILLKVIGFVQRNASVLVPLVAVIGTAVGVFLVLNKAIAIYNIVARAMGASTTAALGPVGLIIIAVAALAVGLIYAYKHSETFRDIVNKVFSKVAAGAKLMWGLIKTIFRAWANTWITLISGMLTGFELIFHVLGKLPGKFGAPFRAAEGSIKSAKDKLNDLKDVINGIHSPPPINVGVKGGQAAINQLANIRYQIDHIPRNVTVGVMSKSGLIPRASGGPVTAGGGYLVGEHGPETFVPSRGGRIVPNGAGGGSVVLNITVHEAGNPAATVEKIREYVRRNGPLRGIVA